MALFQSKILFQILEDYIHSAGWVDADFQFFEVHKSDAYPAASIQLHETTATITLDLAEDELHYELSVWSDDPETGEINKFDAGIYVKSPDGITSELLRFFFAEAIAQGHQLY